MLFLNDFFPFLNIKCNFVVFDDTLNHYERDAIKNRGENISSFVGNFNLLF